MQIKRCHLTSNAETTLFRHISNKRPNKIQYLRPSYFKHQRSFIVTRMLQLSGVCNDGIKGLSTPSAKA